MSRAMRAKPLTVRAMARRLLAPGAAPAGPWRDRDADTEYGVPAQPSWRATDWQHELRSVEVDGIPVNYVDQGSGPGAPIVLVHGLAGQWQNWLENIPRLAQERRVIAFDLPGFGRTPMPREPITITGYGRFVNDLCDALGLGAVVMVGNSMGGYIAAEVAVQFPQRVERLVLVSAAGISSADTVRFPILTAGRIVGAVTTRGAARQRHAARRPITRHLSFAMVARHPRLIKPDLAYEGFFKGVGKPGFDQALRASLDYDFRDRLPAVHVPTLIVWGEKDAVIPVRDADEYERLIPDSRKVVMLDTGHIAMAERPKAFNDLLLDFAAERGPAEAKEPVPGESQAV
jgi:pimeloyl-ACP methyl ester carboxylesterase